MLELNDNGSVEGECGPLDPPNVSALDVVCNIFFKEFAEWGGKKE